MDTDDAKKVALQNGGNLSKDLKSGNIGSDYEETIDVLLPDNSIRRVKVPVNTTWGDLQIQFLSHFKLSPTSHLVGYVSTSDTKEAEATALFGPMNVVMVTIKEKNPKMTVSRSIRKDKATERLIVKLPRSRQSVMRVDPKRPLSLVLAATCDKLKLSAEARLDAELRHPTQHDVRLNLDLTLNHYNLRDVYFVQASESNSLPTSTPPESLHTKRKAPPPPRPPLPSIVPKSKSTSDHEESTSVPRTTSDHIPRPKRRTAPPPPKESPPPSDEQVHGDVADHQNVTSQRETLKSGASAAAEDEHFAINELDKILDEELNNLKDLDEVTTAHVPHKPPRKHKHKDHVVVDDITILSIDDMDITSGKARTFSDDVFSTHDEAHSETQDPKNNNVHVTTEDKHTSNDNERYTADDDQAHVASDDELHVDDAHSSGEDTLEVTEDAPVCTEDDHHTIEDDTIQTSDVIPPVTESEYLPKSMTNDSVQAATDDDNSATITLKNTSIHHTDLPASPTTTDNKHNEQNEVSLNVDKECDDIKPVADSVILKTSDVIEATDQDADSVDDVVETKSSIAPRSSDVITPEHKVGVSHDPPTNVNDVHIPMSHRMQYGDITVYDVEESGEIVQDHAAAQQDLNSDFFDDLPPPPPSLLSDVIIPYGDESKPETKPPKVNDVIGGDMMAGKKLEAKDDGFDLRIAESFNIPIQAIGEKENTSGNNKNEQAIKNGNTSERVPANASASNEVKQQSVESSSEDATAAEIERLHQQIKKMRNSVKREKDTSSRKNWRSGSKTFTFVPNRKMSATNHSDVEVAPVGGIELSNSGDFKAVDEDTPVRHSQIITQEAPKLRPTLPSYYKKFLGANAFAAKDSSSK